MGVLAMHAGTPLCMENAIHRQLTRVAVTMNPIQRLKQNSRVTGKKRPQETVISDSGSAYNSWTVSRPIRPSNESGFVQRTTDCRAKNPSQPKNAENCQQKKR
jgi:hypothetical protein